MSLSPLSTKVSLRRHDPGKRVRRSLHAILRGGGVLGNVGDPLIIQFRDKRHRGIVDGFQPATFGDKEEASSASKDCIMSYNVPGSRLDCPLQALPSLAVVYLCIGKYLGRRCVANPLLLRETCSILVR